MLDTDKLDSVFENIKEDYQTLEDIAKTTTNAIKSLDDDNTKNTYDGLKSVFDALISYRKSESQLEQILRETQIGDTNIIPSMLNKQNTVLDELYRSFVSVRFKDFNTLQEYLTSVLGGFNNLKESLHKTEQEIAIELENMSQSVREYINQQEKLTNTIVQATYSKNQPNQTIDINSLNISHAEKTRQLQDTNRQIDGLIKQLQSDCNNILMNGNYHTYKEVKAMLASIPNMLANARSSGDSSQFAQGLESLIQQTLTLNEQNKQFVDPSNFNTITEYQAKLDKYKNYINNVYNVYSNLSNENAFIDGINTIEQSFESAAKYIKSQTESYIDNQIQSLAQQHSNFTQDNAYSDYILKNSANAFSTHGTNYEQYMMRNLNGVGFLNNSDFQNLYAQFNMNTQSYNNIVSEIHGEENNVSKFSGADKFGLFKDDVLQGRFTQPLISNNDSLIALSHGIDKGQLKRGTVSDKQTAKDIRDSIESAIKRTYKQIQATSRFDPDSKLLKELEKQIRELEKEKEDIDEALNDESLKETKGLFKSLLSPGKILGTGLGFLGLGGLLSLNNWKNMTEQRANDNGAMMYGNYISNISMGADGDLNSFDRVYNQGQDLYQSSYGMIDFNAPTNLYRSLVKGVGGAYGESANEGAQDLNYITKQMVLPSQLYGIGDSTITQFMNSFYKVNKESAQEAVKQINIVMNNARKANIPIEKYISTMSSMGTLFRHLGFAGKNAISNIGFMISTGMRVEDATDMQTQVLNVQNSWSLNKSNSVYAVMTGQAPDLFSAMAMNMLTHDENGDPIGNRQKMIGQQMMAKLNITGMMTNDPSMRKFLYMQNFMDMGFNMNKSNILSGYAASGDTENLGKFLEGAEDEELEKNEKLKDSLKDFQKQLKATSELLGEKQKNKANMIASANKISESFGSHHKGMQELADKIKSAINYVDTHAVEFIKLLAELPEKLKKFREKMEDNPVGGFMISHPILSAALAFGGGYGLYKLGGYSAKRAFGNWNNAGSIAKQNELIESASKSASSGRARNIIKAAKNFLPKGKGKAGMILTAGTLLSSMMFSGTSEAASTEDYTTKSDDENANTWLQMLRDGSAKMRIKNPDGTQYEIIGNTSISKWLINNAGTAEVATATMLGYFALNAKSLYHKYKVPKIKPPTFSPIPPLEPLEKPLTRGGFIKGFAATFALSIGADLMDGDEEQSTSDMIGGALVDTFIIEGASKLLSLAPGGYGKVLQYLPYLSGFIGKGLGVDPIGFLSGNIKESLGFTHGNGSKEKVNTTPFNIMMSSTAEIDAKSFYKLMATDSAQSEYFKQYLDEHGVKYEKLNEVEKQIFAEMVHTLSTAKLSLAQVLALASIGARGNGNVAGSGKGGGYTSKDGRKRLKKEVRDNIEEQIQEQFLGDESVAQDWFKAEALLKYQDNEEDLESETDTDMRYKLNSEQDELSGIVGYVEYLNGDETKLNAQVTAELKTIDKNSGQSRYISNEQVKAKKEEIKSRWSKYYYEWKEELINHYRTRKAQEYVNSDQEWMYEENTEFNDGIEKPDTSPIVADPNGKNAFPQDAINQAQMVSQKTGIPVDYILAFFYLESNGLWELSEQLHNYGNTVYGGSKGKYNEYGWYATTEEGAEALANHTVAFADEESRAILKQAAMSDNPEAFVLQMKAKGYFTDDVNHYLKLFRSGLAMARGAGVQGVANNAQAGIKFNQAKPQTLKEVYDSNIASYQKAMGGAPPKGQKGAIVNGMYVDTSQKFVSVRDQFNSLQNQRSMQSHWQSYNAKKNDLAQNATDRAVRATEEANIKAQREEQEKMKQIVDDESRRIAEQRATESNIAHLTIMGRLKKGKSLGELREVLEDALKDYGMDAKTYFKDVDQIAI